MKKKMRRIFSLVLAFVMIMAMAVTAGAVNTGSITVTGAVDGKTYNIYRIFDLTYSTTEDGKNNVAYTIADKWSVFFESGAGAEYIVNEQGTLTNQIIVNGTTKYINITEANKAAFAEAALDYALKNSILNDGSTQASEGTATFSNLALGYYMVYPEGATDIKDGQVSICSLTSTVPDAEVSPKADYPTITKTVSDPDVQYGQTVTYTITGKVPDTTGYTDYTYKVSDTMSGLTLNGTYDVKIDGTSIKESENITGTAPTAEATSFEMTIDVTQYQDKVGKSIVITYDAVVSADAVIGPDGNENNATLVYSNKPNETTSSTPVKVKVYTCQITIDKVDGATNEKLDGAKFVLINSENKYYKLDNGVVSWVTDIKTATEVETDDKGAAEFKGIEAGTYQLVETEAPEGYNLLTEPVEVTITSTGDNAHATITKTIANNTGTELPSTGGMGTIIFYALGAMLAVGAGVILVTKKRVSNKEN